MYIGSYKLGWEKSEVDPKDWTSFSRN